VSPGHPVSVLQKNFGANRRGDRKNQFSPVIILVLFVSLFACFIFGD
jgi:hypothetical protein